MKLSRQCDGLETTDHARLTSNSLNMLPFDIRHPSRDAALNFHRKWQPVADLKPADDTIVNATDILEQLCQRLLQFEIDRQTRGLPFGRPELHDLHHDRQRIQHWRAATYSDGFDQAEPELLKKRNEPTLGWKKVGSGAWTSDRFPHESLSPNSSSSNCIGSLNNCL
jgi:hypothetical protein